MMDGIVLKGERIVVPETMRKYVLNKLHQAHMGMEKMKMRARETVFWPGVNKHIEDIVKVCETCLHNARKQTQEMLISSEIPTHPFEIIGTGLFFGTIGSLLYCWTTIAVIGKLKNHLMQDRKL